MCVSGMVYPTPNNLKRLAYGTAKTQNGRMSTFTFRRQLLLQHLTSSWLWWWCWPFPVVAVKPDKRIQLVCCLCEVLSQQCCVCARQSKTWGSVQQMKRLPPPFSHLTFSISLSQYTYDLYRVICLWRKTHCHFIGVDILIFKHNCIPHLILCSKDLGFFLQGYQ